VSRLFVGIGNLTLTRVTARDGSVLQRRDGWRSPLRQSAEAKTTGTISAEGEGGGESDLDA
jgi:hypothetical protein